MERQNNVRKLREKKILNSWGVASSSWVEVLDKFSPDVDSSKSYRSTWPFYGWYWMSSVVAGWPSIPVLKRLKASSWSRYI